MAEPRRADGGIGLSVGALSADLMNLGDAVTRLEATGVTALHFDVMDGRFCPDLTVGAWFVAATATTLVKDVHLMVAEPQSWIEPCVRAGAGIITVHLESGTHAHRALELVAECAREQGQPRPLRGVGICPGTPISHIEPYLDVADIVYLLGINPGWRQPLLDSTADRARQLRDLLRACGRPVQLAIDGGVTLANFAEIADLEPDLVVSGSAVFARGEVEQNLAAFARCGARLDPDEVRI